MEAKHQLQAFCCRDCWIQWGSILHCCSVLPLSSWYFPRNNSKETTQRSYGSLCPFFPRRPSTKSGNCCATSCQVRCCIIWGQWLLWISYQDFYNPRFNHSLFTFWSSSGKSDTAVITKTFFTAESLNFSGKPTLLSDTRMPMSKTDRHILRKPPPPLTPILTSRYLQG